MEWNNYAFTFLCRGNLDKFYSLLFYLIFIRIEAKVNQPVPSNTFVIFLSYEHAFIRTHPSTHARKQTRR